MECDLYTEALRLLRADTRTLNEIALGAGVNYHWLGKFKQGVYADPGVRRVQRVYEFLRKAQDGSEPAGAQVEVRA